MTRKEKTAQRLIVRVSMGFDVGGLEHFLPGGRMVMGRLEFRINPPDYEHCDFWIIFGNSAPCEVAKVAPENTLLIVGEPPAKKIYPKLYYRQFAHLVDTHAASGHPGLVLDALGLLWMVGLSWRQNAYTYGYDYLKSLAPPGKRNLVSVVCSDTAKTAGQRERLEFLSALKARLGDKIVHFGKGFSNVDDKMEAILPYRFHLVLENSRSKNYWTEKLADAYLGWAFPLQVGCPNLNDYFDPDSFISLDPTKVDQAVERIIGLLESPQTVGEVEAIRSAREKILEVYHPFRRFGMWVDCFYQEAPATSVWIRFPKGFNPLMGWYHRLRKGRLRKTD